MALKMLGNFSVLLFSNEMVGNLTNKNETQMHAIKVHNEMKKE